MEYEFAVDMTGRNCLVTGATSGHGEAVATALARQGAHVTIHGRNVEKLARVQNGIFAATGNRPELLTADFSSLDDVRRAVQELKARKKPLHLLVNNAGMVNRHFTRSHDGYEEVFAVNYLAMFLFTLLTADMLIKSAPARIVNVASDAHYIGKLDLDNLDQQDRYSLMGAYSRSKLAIVYFTRELAQRLDPDRVTVNAVDPGPIRSGIAKKEGLLAKIADIIIQATFPTAEKAATSCLYLCMSPEVSTITGKYFRFMSFKEPKINSDPAFAQKLWDKTVEITGIDLKIGS